MNIDFNKIIEVPEQGLARYDQAIKPPNEKIDQVLIPEEYIRKRIKNLARQICNEHKNIQEMTLVIILKGAIIFASDLARAIYLSGGPDIKFNFLKASYYGKGIKSISEFEREVKIELEPEEIKGESVLIVEDLLDQGFTLSKIRDYLSKKTKSLEICILFEKRIAPMSEKVKTLKNNLHCDYIGFRIPDRWIAGYGIDAGEDFRQLPFVVTVKEEYYKKW